MLRTLIICLSLTVFSGCATDDGSGGTAFDDAMVSAAGGSSGAGGMSMDLDAGGTDATGGSGGEAGGGMGGAGGSGGGGGVEAPDADDDGISDENDNCPEVPNPDQLDTDGDGLGDACDVLNDVDTGIETDAFMGPLDQDEDGVSDSQDNCPDRANPEQIDTDGMASVMRVIRMRSLI